MARKKATEKNTTALVPWEQEMAEAAARAASAEKPTGTKSIGLRGGQMTIDDSPVEDNEISVVVLAAVHENQYFTGRYNPQVKQSPVCYAYSDPDAAPEDAEDSMRPHPEAPDKQAEACKVCPMNEWGSAETGKGKACKNVRRLALILEESLEDAESLEEAEVRMLKVPVTSVKNWSAYVRNKLAAIGRPSYGVVTKVKVVPDEKNQFKVLFSFERTVEFDAELYEAMKAKVAAVEKDMRSAYPVHDELEEKPKVRGKKPLPQVGRATRRKF